MRLRTACFVGVGDDLSLMIDDEFPRTKLSDGVVQYLERLFSFIEH